MQAIPLRSIVYNDRMKILLFAFVAMVLTFAASAEEIVLKNGKIVQGTVWKEIGGTVILKGPDGILLNIKKEEIDQEKTVQRKKSGPQEVSPQKEVKSNKPPKKLSKEYLESIREKYDLGQGSYGEVYELNLQEAAKYKDFSIRQDRDFERKVLKASRPVIVDFWAAWCGPCKVIAPHVESVEKEFRDQALIYRVNIDDQPEIASFYKVNAIPTLVYFNNGEEVDRVIGAASKDVISARLKPLLK
jgi:thioredoxin 1